MRSKITFFIILASYLSFQTQVCFAAFSPPVEKEEQDFQKESDSPSESYQDFYVGDEGLSLEYESLYGDIVSEQAKFFREHAEFFRKFRSRPIFSSESLLSSTGTYAISFFLNPQQRQIEAEERAKRLETELTRRRIEQLREQLEVLEARVLNLRTEYDREIQNIEEEARIREASLRADRVVLKRNLDHLYNEIYEYVNKSLWTYVFETL